VFENLRKSLAKVITPPRSRMSPLDRAARKALRESAANPAGRAGARYDTRMYQAAKASRLTSGWATSTTSADSELSSSLTTLRNRSRALVRDSGYAKRAKVIVQNNVVGSGVGMQAQVMSTRDTLREDVNDSIETAWEDWCCAENCHTGGTLHFADFERIVLGQIFEAGEVFVRKHLRRFGDSEVPFAIELIEAERLADEFSFPTIAAALAPDATLKMGKEQDKFGRPLAYWIRQMHPGELRFIPGATDKLERVPADQIVHLRIVDRWPQTRGEPWLHAAARKLNDMDGYSEAEIVAARAAATTVFTIETGDDNSPLAGQSPASGDAGADISKELAVEAGMGLRLAPGEKWETHSPNRPNTALDAFMRYMLREVAAAVGVSYESLSRDYSQSNYSSSRLSLLDDRDLWRVLQGWYLRNFRQPIHKEWLQAAVLAGAIPAVRVDEYAVSPKKFEAVLFKPRGWGWIDPTKEVAAYKEAVKAGFKTVSDVIAETGGGQDIEDVLRQRRRELVMMDPSLEPADGDTSQLKLEFDTSPSVYVVAETKSGQGGMPKSNSPPGDQSPPGDENKSTQSGPPLRAVSFPAR